jgi:hypothetical protein
VALSSFEGVRVVRWVGHELVRGRRHGWTGELLSGYRTDREQLAAAARFAASRGVPVASIYPNGPLASNHCHTAWPAGAADVTDPRGLRDALRRARWPTHRRRLVWAIDVGFDDAAHFSRNGH